MNKPFNGVCQTKDCKGNLQKESGYVYHETQPYSNNPWDVKRVREHIIDVYQCDKCSRIHGSVVESTGETIEFYNWQSSAVNFHTPSQFGTGGNSSQLNEKVRQPEG